MEKIDQNKWTGTIEPGNIYRSTKNRRLYRVVLSVQGHRFGMGEDILLQDMESKFIVSISTVQMIPQFIYDKKFSNNLIDIKYPFELYSDDKGAMYNEMDCI